MTPEQIKVADLTAALTCVVLAGIAVRRRAHLSWAFLAYLVAVLLGNRLTVWWPDTFYRGWFWSLKSSVYTGLTCLLAVEITLLTFAVAPRAKRRALIAMAVIAALALMGVALPARVASYPGTVLSVLAPRAQTAALWMLLVPFAMARWHLFPLHAYHRFIVVGRAVYLAFDVVLLSLLGTRDDWHVAQSYLGALEPLAFAATLFLWAFAAWRPLEMRSGILADLQPWAARC